MDTDAIIASVVAFYHTHQLAAIAIGAGLLLFAFLRPKAFFQLLALAAIAAVLFYGVSMLMETALVGTKQKEAAATRTEKALE